MKLIMDYVRAFAVGLMAAHLDERGSFVYTGEKARRLTGSYSMATADMRVLLVLNTTTADTDQDAAFLVDVTTMAEVSDGSYSRKALTTEAVNTDNPNNRAEFDADDVSWTSLTTGGTVQAVVLYRHVDGTAANDMIVAFIDTGGFPVSITGGTLSITWNVEGIVQAT